MEQEIQDSFFIQLNIQHKIRLTKNYVKVIFIMVLTITTATICGYELSCPHSSHRKARAEGICGNSTNVAQYACLFDELSGFFNESCSEKDDFVSPGRKYVVSVHRKSVECSQSRFQPIKFQSKELSICMYSKSDCSEVGQILYSSGSIETDVKCSCDYRQNYSFIHLPKNLCFCVPTEEDCSCFVQTCQRNEILSSGYECVPFIQGLKPNGTMGAKTSCDQLEKVNWTLPIDSPSKIPPQSADLVPKGGKRTSYMIIRLPVLSPILTVCMVFIACCFSYVFSHRIISNGGFPNINCLRKNKAVSFKCRFCYKCLTNSSSKIKKDVDNAKVNRKDYLPEYDSYLQEVQSNIDENICYNFFTTTKADVLAMAEPNTDNKSWFTNYTFQPVTCCKQKPIGWKYTHKNDGKKHKPFYGILIDLVLGRYDNVLCKKDDCHAKVALGCDLINQPADNVSNMSINKQCFAKKKDVLVQKLEISKTVCVTILTFCSANVEASKTKCDETSFQDFDCFVVKCYQCESDLGWKYDLKPEKVCWMRTNSFYALRKDKLLDVSAAEEEQQ